MEDGMRDYRCYFVNSADHIAGAEEIQADTDAEAIEQARARVAGQPRCTAEIWQDSRLVLKNIQPNGACRDTTSALRHP
jgi:hypothetical protein